MHSDALTTGRRVATAALTQLPEAVLAASGRALYSPASTLISGSPLYFLGDHPGETGTPGETAGRVVSGAPLMGTEVCDQLTVKADLERLYKGQIVEHGYLDEAWKGSKPGKSLIQARAQRIFTILCEGDSRQGEHLFRNTPTSNMLLPRSADTKLLTQRSGFSMADMARHCWPFHAAVIAECECEIVLTHAVSAARHLANWQKLADPQTRPSGWGGSLNTLYAWRLPNGPRLLAIPHLSRYDPSGMRSQHLAAFFREFGLAR